MLRKAKLPPRQQRIPQSLLAQEILRKLPVTGSPLAAQVNPKPLVVLQRLQTQATEKVLLAVQANQLPAAPKARTKGTLQNRTEPAFVCRETESTPYRRTRKGALLPTI